MLPLNQMVPNHKKISNVKNRQLLIGGDMNVASDFGKSFASVKNNTITNANDNGELQIFLF